MIIGLLATVVAPKLFDKLGTARISAAKSDMLAMDDQWTGRCFLTLGCVLARLGSAGVDPFLI